MAKSKRTGETRFKNNETQYKYTDGAWRRVNGQLAELHPGQRKFTKANAKAMSVRGQDAKMAKKQEAIRKAVEDISGLPMHLSGDAIAYIAGELAKETLQHDNPLRDRVYTYKEIGGDAGLVNRRSGGGGTQAIQVNINISEKATEGIEVEDEILDALWEEID